MTCGARKGNVAFNLNLAADCRWLAQTFEGVDKDIGISRHNIYGVFEPVPTA